MHSSRMRTGRSLTAFPEVAAPGEGWSGGVPGPGGVGGYCGPGGVPTVPGGVVWGRGGTWSRGGVWGEGYLAPGGCVVWGGVWYLVLGGVPGQVLPPCEQNE